MSIPFFSPVFQLQIIESLTTNKLLYQISETIVVLRFQKSNKNGCTIRKKVEPLSINIPLDDTAVFLHEDHVEDQLTKQGISIKDQKFVLLFADTRAIVDHKALNERAPSLKVWRHSRTHRWWVRGIFFVFYFGVKNCLKNKTKQQLQILDIVCGSITQEVSSSLKVLCLELWLAISRR